VIPPNVEAHLRRRYGAHAHRVQAGAPPAERAAAEHVRGSCLARPVLLRLDGELAIAVIAATDRVNVRPLEEATGARAVLVPAEEAAERFRPCAPGTQPPFAIFGVPIYVDEKLARERTIVVPAGTREDAVAVEVGEWIWCERVRTLANLGVPARRAA
jgi:Ala-tRNA(Pro) deacylase